MHIKIKKKHEDLIINLEFVTTIRIGMDSIYISYPATEGEGEERYMAFDRIDKDQIGASEYWRLRDFLVGTCSESLTFGEVKNDH